MTLRNSRLEEVLRPEQLEFLEQYAENDAHQRMLLRDAVESKIQSIAGRRDYEDDYEKEGV